MAAGLILITGGARSGKSGFAERLAMQGNRVLFVATAEALDDDMARRIAAHRTSRPSEWDTLEEPRAVPQAILRETAASTTPYDTIIVDCLTIWVSNLLLLHEGSADARSTNLGGRWKTPRCPPVLQCEVDRRYKRSWAGGRPHIPSRTYVP